MKKDRIKTLTIYRNFWGMHNLLSDTGNRMCCLGHLGLACGIPKEKMRSVGSPSSLEDKFNAKYPKQFTETFFDQAVVINDQEDLTTKEKEEKLRILFKRYGVQLRFTGLRCQARVNTK